MINYNDGKWHAWNGGECPVHPESMVEVTLYQSGSTTEKASYWDWAHYNIPGDIVSFRVTKPYVEPPKPAEKWILGNHAFDSKEAAEQFLSRLIADHGERVFAAPKWKPRLFREVQE